MPTPLQGTFMSAVSNGDILEHIRQCDHCDILSSFPSQPSPILPNFSVLFKPVGCNSAALTPHRAGSTSSGNCAQRRQNTSTIPTDPTLCVVRTIHQSIFQQERCAMSDHGVSFHFPKPYPSCSLTAFNRLLS